MICFGGGGQRCKLSSTYGGFEYRIIGQGFALCEIEMLCYTGQDRTLQNEPK